MVPGLLEFQDYYTLQSVADSRRLTDIKQVLQLTWDEVCYSLLAEKTKLLYHSKFDNLMSASQKKA